MTIKEAQSKGITKLRKAIWANPLDHLEVGPLWLKLYAPCNLGINGRDPVEMLCLSVDCSVDEWEEYTGPAADSEQYQKESTEFAEHFAKRGLEKEPKDG